jgi:hypothetical protein
VYERLALPAVRNFISYGPYRPAALRDHEKQRGSTRQAVSYAAFQAATDKLSVEIDPVDATDKEIADSLSVELGATGRRLPERARLQTATYTIHAASAGELSA